jgi:hypothetical protein
MATPKFGHFSRDLNLKTKPGTGNFHVADDFAAKRIITSFDIGHIDVSAQNSRET